MEVKPKINELNRPLFPELAISLEKYGQLQPILIDENGYVHDGQKRVLLCGIEQLTKTIVPVNAPCSNESNLKRSTKQILVKSLWETANKSYGLSCAKKLAERYGVSIRTINRWVEPEIKTNVAIAEKPRSQTIEPKDMMCKCPYCHKIFSYDELESGTYENLEQLLNTKDDTTVHNNTVNRKPFNDHIYHEIEA